MLQPIVLGERAAPPADPAPGDCYLVAESATGAWAAQDRALAVWAENQWVYLPPRAGARVHDLSTGSSAAFSATAGWQRIAAPALPVAGATQDGEARAAIAAIVAALRAAGIFSG